MFIFLIFLLLLLHPPHSGVLVLDLVLQLLTVFLLLDNRRWSQGAVLKHIRWLEKEVKKEKEEKKEDNSQATLQIT